MKTEIFRNFSRATFLAKISKQKCPGPADVVKLCLKRTVLQAVSSNLKNIIAFPLQSRADCIDSHF